MNYKYVKLLSEIVDLECKRDDIIEKLFEKEMELLALKERIELREEVKKLLSCFLDYTFTYDNDYGIVVIAALLDVTGVEKVVIGKAYYDPADDADKEMAELIAVREALDLDESEV